MVDKVLSPTCSGLSKVKYCSLFILLINLIDIYKTYYLQESDVVTSGVSIPNLPEFPPSFTDQVC